MMKKLFFDDSFPLLRQLKLLFLSLSCSNFFFYLCGIAVFFFF